MRKTRIFYLHSTVFALAVALAVPALANDKTGTSAESTTGSTTKVAGKTTDFLKEAFQDSQAEIQLGQIGARKAQNPQLKQFAQQMEQDRTKAQSDLKALAEKYGAKLGQKLPWLEERAVSKFEKMTSSDFDREFAEQMLKDHQKTIAKFERASDQEHPSDVQQYIQQTLPKLREHMQHAEQVAQAIGVSQDTISKYVKKAEKHAGGTFDRNEPSSGAGASSHQDVNR